MEAVKEPVRLLEIERELAGPDRDEAFARYDAILAGVDRRLAAALRDGGFVIQHEAVLAPRCRIDFLVDGIGVEVKRGKPPKSALLKQCTRYLASEQLKR